MSTHVLALDAGASARPVPRGDRLPSLILNERQRCELELLLGGVFRPLEGFLGRNDYDRVLEDACLADGTPWPMPVTLDVGEAFSAGLSRGSEVMLRGSDGVLLAVLDVEDIYWPDHLYEARRIYGTSDRRHAGVAELLDRTGPVYLGGRVRGIRPPLPHDAGELDGTSRRLRDWLAARRREPGRPVDIGPIGPGLLAQQVRTLLRHKGLIEA
jgi:sulfate adenylyltransferase